jgi:hypothetical protein
MASIPGIRAFGPVASRTGTTWVHNPKGVDDMLARIAGGAFRSCYIPALANNAFEVERRVCNPRAFPVTRESVAAGSWLPS